MAAYSCFRKGCPTIDKSIEVDETMLTDIIGSISYYSTSSLKIMVSQPNSRKSTEYLYLRFLLLLCGNTSVNHPAHSTFRKF